jgi:CRISPR/Cas system-associated endoribonuclease Cas2
METQAIEISSELKDRELLTALVNGLASLWHYPEHLINATKPLKDLSIVMGSRNQKSKGFYVTAGYVLHQFLDSKVKYEIGFPEELTEQDQLGTFVEEVTHMLQLILNPHLQKQLLEAHRLENKLEEVGVLDAGILSNILVSTDFIAEIRLILEKYTELVEEPTKPSFKDILTQYFRNEFRISRLNLRDNDLANYAAYLSNSGFVPEITSEDLEKLKEKLNELSAANEAHLDFLINHSDGKKMTPEELTAYQEESRRLGQAERDLEKSEEILNVQNKIVARIESSTEEELEQLAEALGLSSLQESLWLDALVAQLKMLTDVQGRPFVLDVMTKASGKLLNRLHWDMRPGGYYSTVEEMDTWMAAESDEEKRSLVIKRLDSYSSKSLNNLVLVILEEEIGNTYCESVGEASAMSSDLFWDIPEGSNLGSNPEYVKANAQAIKTELGAKNILGNDEYQDLTQGRTGNTKPHISNQIQDILSGKSDLLDSRMATLRAATQTNVRTRMNDSVNFSALNNTVYTHIEATRHILNSGRDIRNVLSLVPYLSSIYQQIEFINVSKSLMLELVAKAVVKYLVGIEPDIVDEHGFLSSYGLHLTAYDEEMKSPWAPFIEAMAAFLSKYDSYGYIKLLQCKDIPTIAKLVGYEA